MTPYDAADVVLVRFPFTDLSSSKKRAAVVVNPAGYSGKYGDVVVLALTSQPQKDKSLELQDWKRAGLLKPTWCRPVIGTLARTLIVRRLGRLSARDRLRVKTALQLAIAPEFLS